ncbi:DNA replication licensing factor MCM6 [Hordeum vulgare]|nr:DNA replication licensing factor MCM6 [Hordeum vulgare]
MGIPLVSLWSLDSYDLDGFNPLLDSNLKEGIGLHNNIIAELQQKACEINSAWIIIAFVCPQEWSAQVSGHLLTKHFEQEASLHQHGIKSANKQGDGLAGMKQGDLIIWYVEQQNVQGAYSCTEEVKEEVKCIMAITEECLERQPRVHPSAVILVRWIILCTSPSDFFSLNCLEGESATVHENGTAVVCENGHPKMRPVFWVDHRSKPQAKDAQFIDINITHVLPYDMRDMECHSLNVSSKVSGVRLGDNDSNSKFDLGVPDDLGVSVELRNWLFALEGTEEVGDWSSPRSGDPISREDKCWHTTFRNLHLSGKSSDRPNLGGAEKVLDKKAFPVESFTAGIEGLQAIKPRLRNQIVGNGKLNNNQSGSGKLNNSQSGSGLNNTSAIGDQGVDVEATMVIGEDETGDAKWMMDNVKFSVKEPIEAVAKKEELEHLFMICRSEADAMGRITAGILRLLKLDKSLGQGTIEQLRNLVFYTGISSVIIGSIVTESTKTWLEHSNPNLRCHFSHLFAGGIGVKLLFMSTVFSL